MPNHTTGPAHLVNYLCTERERVTRGASGLDESGSRQAARKHARATALAGEPELLLFLDDLVRRAHRIRWAASQARLGGA